MATTPTCHSCDADLPDATDILCAACSLAEDYDPTPCCPDPGCGSNPCTFSGYADNH